METPNPRIHSALIKALAEGSVIQVYDENENEWFDCREVPAAALKGEEPEELKKLRRENEELKAEVAKLKKDLAQLNLSAGERALIQALRNGEIIEVVYGGVYQLIMEVSMPDAVYDAIEKIKAEQEARNE